MVGGVREGTQYHIHTYLQVLLCYLRPVPVRSDGIPQLGQKIMPGGLFVSKDT